MASITALGDKQNRKYRARWRTPDGASRSKTFTRKADAERFLAGITVSTTEGNYIDPAAGRATFGEYAKAWAAAQPHRATTADGVERILRLHILPTFEKRPIASIRTSEVQAWVSSLELAPSSVAVTYGKLVAVFNAAVEDRLIARSPCTRRIRLPRAHGSEVVPMSAQQVAAMVNAVDDRYRAYVLLLAGTGLRPGEGLGVTVDRVDFLRRQLRVDRQLLTINGAQPVLGPTKTPSSVRTIPVPQIVLDELARHIEVYGTGPDGLLFTNTHGRLIRRADLSRLWRQGMKRVNAAAKKDADVRIASYTTHDLRHYAASVLIDRGASVKAVQRHLGHASAKTTLDTYAHLWPESEEATRTALASGLTAVVSPSCHDRADVAGA